ncbi:hypothetical protein KA005_81390, partial [bacterium]|nr:hypothetical protein [bacterium]
IEDHWRGGANKRFERLVSNIADRRARDVREAEIGSFAECLQDTLDGTEWQEQFKKIADIVAARVRDRAKEHQRYSEWIAERESFEGSAREIAIAWRTLEVLIERDKRKTQRSFDFELSKEDLQQRDGSDVHAAAELFFCREFNIPYYYGLSRLASMASSNIEQFLWLAGDLFEESVSAVLLKQSAHLNPISQERIIKDTIKKRWTTLPQRVKHGTDVYKFLDAVGKFSRWETDKPNAPYSPGVTGIAISMSDRAKLNDPEFTQNDPDLMKLVQVLSSCIAHNLLEPTLNRKSKGQYWMVLNLNRLLCVYFELPLQYGGWREKTLKELITWINKGFIPPSKNSEMFL